MERSPRSQSSHGTRDPDLAKYRGLSAPRRGSADDKPPGRQDPNAQIENQFASRPRAHILLPLAARHQEATVSAVLLCSFSTISRRKRRFESDGVDAVLGRPRGRRRSGIQNLGRPASPVVLDPLRPRSPCREGGSADQAVPVMLRSGNTEVDRSEAASVDQTDARKRRPEDGASWPPLWPGIRLETHRLTVQSSGSSYVRPNRGRRPMAEWNADAPSEDQGEIATCVTVGFTPACATDYNIHKCPCILRP